MPRCECGSDADSGVPGCGAKDDRKMAISAIMQITAAIQKTGSASECAKPSWSNTFDLTVRQNIPIVSSDQRVAVQLDIFNFGNLLNKKWGQQKVSPYSGNSNVPLLTHTAMSSTDPKAAVPTVTFNYRTLDPNKTGTLEEYQVGNFVSNYWRMQLSARVSF